MKRNCKFESPTKLRKHSNNVGYRQVKRGTIITDVVLIARSLGIPTPHKLSSKDKKGRVLYY